MHTYVYIVYMPLLQDYYYIYYPTLYFKYINKLFNIVNNFLVVITLF